MKNLFRKKIKSDISFEEWAKENNVVLTHAPAKTIHVKKRAIGWIATAVSFLLVAAIILPFLFSSSDNAPKIYSSNDADPKNITIEELYQKEGVLLFNLESVFDYDSISADIAKDNSTLILGYKLYNCLIGASDGENAFYVDYFIRLYPYYEFNTYQSYTDLILNFTVNSIQIKYNIQISFGDEFAYLCFSYNNLEYFLCIKGFEGVTEINETTIKLLLTDLLVN